MEDLSRRIREKARETGAVILAHNYQRPEVQDVADFVGDSLELSIKAMETDAKTIVFAGVDFMVEQAAFLNPGKKVLTPEPGSICPMAWQLDPPVVEEYRRKNPDAPLVVYVNSFIEVKSMADYVVTSSSASKLVSKLDSEKILFGPDRNLASYVAETTGKEVIAVPLNSYCPVHVNITADKILAVKRGVPDAKVLAHPECPPETRRLADFIGSTSQIIRAVGEINAKRFIIGTENGVVYRISKLYPDKEAYPVGEDTVCPNMKKITLEKVYRSLISGETVVKIDEKLAEKARRVLERSFALLGVETPWSRK
ncbi:MAG: quinolinate synthase NadA [Thaumarchaeota archaeon]|jgi:quinolinate synthase|nr:quinolinate synthase NadA [Nitrososphaerota archaeon]